jgi:transmembrane sensor
MLKGKDYYQHLLQRYVDNDCTPQETAELLDYIQSDGSDRLLLAEMKMLFDNSFHVAGQQEPAAWSQKVKNNLIKNSKPTATILSIARKWLPRVAAAFLLFAASLGAYQYFNSTQNTKTLVVAQSNQSTGNAAAILPGGNKALLTLADGTVIVLDEAGNGNVASQGATSIHKKNHLVIYDATKADGKAGPVAYNTITTPKGGQYQLILPDGSKVWLNAASSLHFPTAFSGADRRVTLTGEGYFEIAKDAAKPFFVMVNNMNVEVLGTHFNVMAYDNEDALKTTLLEGSVKVNAGTVSKTIKPGQQAKYQHTATAFTIVNANIEETVAWKNGYFQFNNEDLKSIMRQFARWYDVEVSYEGQQKIRQFSGEVSRDVNLAQALKVLQLSNVKFRIENKKIVVLY